MFFILTPDFWLLTPREGFSMSILTYREALNQAMREEMRRDETIVLMGEEVGFYQGA